MNEGGPHRRILHLLRMNEGGSSEEGSLKKEGGSCVKN
jgi:hypothetical protein